MTSRHTDNGPVVHNEFIRTAPFSEPNAFTGARVLYETPWVAEDGTSSRRHANTARTIATGFRQPRTKGIRPTTRLQYRPRGGGMRPEYQTDVYALDGNEKIYVF